MQALLRSSGMRRVLQQQQEAPSSADGDDDGGSAVILLIIVGCLLLVALGAWRMWRMSRWWANRARSAKVLDEIEMEFVNDDADMFVDDDILRGTSSRHAR
jgi:flagellar basal body-associated protein FliL